MSELSPTQLEVMKNAFVSIPEQMGAALQRSSYSPNIKERKDESCALFSADAKLLAQAEHIPVHLGAMPNALDAAVERCELSRGDQIILNDPYKGGTHLPDITIIKPVWSGEDFLGYVVNRAHHSDIGGKTPGSMPGDSKTLQDEGIVIPPMHIMDKGEIVEDVMEMFRNLRCSSERIGDLRAQMGANELGASEFTKAVRRFGLDSYGEFVDDVIRYSEKRTREAIKGMQDFDVKEMDVMEWKEPVELHLSMKKEGDAMRFDFQGTHPQVQGNINAPAPVTHSAVYYVLRCLIPDDIPITAGCYEPISIDIPKGTVLNPEPPAAVSSGNVETSQRVVELILKCLRQVLPDTIPAESQGTMNNVTIGNDNFTFYETIGGGAGAYWRGGGEDGVHVHMTNTQNTPIESVENEYPLRVKQYRLRKGSGGAGRYKGGDGIVKEIEFLEDCHLSIQSERREHEPKGMKGGGNGKRGENILLSSGEKILLGSRVSRDVKAGDALIIKTPGGGGWGEKNDS
ncbi:MAG: hydantoinase B/oxoprolinase family protein [Thermoplasmata archaeon]